jgi:hypothetical protein
MKTKFTADQFVATQWATAADKARFANTLLAFITAGMPRAKFTKALYQRLSNCFGHIAHYNLDGFYATWFATPQQRHAFMHRLADWTMHGQPDWTFGDVERAVQQAIRGELYERFAREANEDTERAERAALRQLAAKYPDEVK